MSLVTIDFHNTLFQCDDWFRLEVETLPVAYLRRKGQASGDARDADREREALTAYREIRTSVMASGQECDAETSLKLVLQHVKVTDDDSEIQCAVSEIMRATVASATPIPGAVELVHRLRANGTSLAVVSSAAYHPFLEWCLSEHAMRDAFQAVVTSASCGIYKSDPAIYRHTLSLFGANAADAVHIGDSPRFDVASAQKAGMKTILFSSTLPDDLVPEPDAVIRELGEAPEHLDRLLSGPQAT